MNKGMKTFLMVCGIVVGVGLLLSIVGFVLGGVKGLNGIEERMPWISFGSGQVESQQQNTSAFSSVNIDCDMGGIEFVEGKQYSVEMDYAAKLGAPAVKVENNTLTITPSSRTHGWFNFNLIGIGNYAKTKIKVYYPKGSTFNQVKVSNDMGDVVLNNIKAQTMDLNADAGSIELDQIDVGSLKIDADMGDVKGTNIKTGGADISLDAGSLTLSGAFAGMTKIDSDMGSCTLNTSLPKTTYSIEAKMDLGDCEVDGVDVGSNYTVTNASASNHLKLNCDTGDVKVNFQ